MKHVAMIVVIAMVLAALCGCSASLVKLTDVAETEASASPEADATPEATAEPTPEPTPEAPAKVTINWRGYELNVEYCAFDDEAAAQDKPNGRWLRVMYSMKFEGIKMADVQEYSDEFAIIDADGSKYTSNMIGHIVVKFDAESGVSIAETQDSFSLIYDVPADTDLTTLTLDFGGDSPVSLGGIPHEMPVEE